MNLLRWEKLKRFTRLFAMKAQQPAEQESRVLAVQRIIVLPARLTVAAVVTYYLFYWCYLPPKADTTRDVVLATLRGFYVFYVIVNSLAAVFMLLRRFPPGLVQWVIFVAGLLDGALLGGLTLQSGGFESNLFWVFPVLIIINAISISLAAPQIVLNVCLSGFYLWAGVLDRSIADDDTRFLNPEGAHPRVANRATTSSQPFTTADIHNLKSLVSKVTHPGGAAGISQFLYSHLATNTLNQLSNYNKGHEAPQLQASLADDLNRIVQSRPIYTPERFANIDLSDETEKLLENPASKTNWAKLNRSVLQDAYPHELKAGFMRSTTTLNALPTEPAEPYFLKITVLWLLTACCYGVQLLAFRDRQAEEEAREFANQSNVLAAAGRLAGEIAHQLKNPLGIINNAAFSLQRSLKDAKADSAQQVTIIRDEIERSDRIITQLMGYAQLCEGRVEKLSVTDELDFAISEVFPAGDVHKIEVHRNYAGLFPPLLMQRSHLLGILVNLLQNAREAMADRGNIHVSAEAKPDYSIEVVVADDGPGIPPDKLNLIFEAYFTTKEKGTGLGLAIVRHNVELYGGNVRVDSELGKGTRFTLVFPAKRIIRLGK